MTHDDLRTEDDVYESLKSSLTDKITKLTNFTDRSFNYVWTRAFAEEVRRLEVLALTSELAGWIDYTGGPVTQRQLERLGFDEDRVTAEEVNDIMHDEYLDEYVKIVGINRFDGARATGTVDIETQSGNTTIEEGTLVSTTPNEDGQTLTFETTEVVETAANQTTATDVPIRATEVGDEYNIPANTIVRFPDPPVGVRGVTNPAAPTGGEDKESNEDLRERAKQQVEGASEGGTVEGIKAYLRQNIEAVRQGDVIIEEFLDEQPVFVDVIVDGGSDTEVLDAIEESRPAGVRHNLIRPQIVQLGVRTDLLGDDIDKTEIVDEVETFLINLGIGENFYEAELIRRIMQADINVINVSFLQPTYDRVTNERFQFDTEIDRAISDDGGSLTDETSEANNVERDDVTLLPESPAVDDAFYFGETEPFTGFAIDISTEGVGTWDVVWEYWDGNSWKGLNNVSDGTADFTSGGASTVYWDLPSDWLRTDVGGNSRYFVRARVDSFTSVTTAPRGRQIEIIGNTYRLDFTYEDTNGSIDVTDEGGNAYTEGTEYTMTDWTNDGWPETIVWDASNAVPEAGEEFFVSYDVTTADTSKEDRYTNDLVRDEAFRFNRNATENFDYDDTQSLYEMNEAPFVGSTSIEDGSGDTYVEGTDYDIIDDSNDGVEQTIDWSIGTAKPDNDEEFFINYTRRTYELQYEVYETPGGLITDEWGTEYNQDTEFTIEDLSGDDEKDTILWQQDPSSLNDDEEFYLTYLSEGNIEVEAREKIDPSTDRIDVRLE